MAEQFRVTSFGQPRSEWRDDYSLALLDAIRLGLASRDQERKTWYVAVPVDIERRGKPEQADRPYPTREPQLRERWTDEDLATLRQIAKDGAGALAARLFLGRSRNAVARKARALGLQLDSPPAPRRRHGRSSAHTG